MSVVYRDFEWEMGHASQTNESDGLFSIADNYYNSPSLSQQADISGTFSAASSGDLNMLPFTFTHRQTVKEVRMILSTGDAGKVCRLGIWRMGRGGLPAGIVWQSADISVAPLAVPAASCRLAFGPETIWLGFVVDSTTVAISALDRAQLRRLGQATAGANGTTHFRYSLGWTSGTALGQMTAAPTQRTGNPPAILMQIVGE